MNELAVIRQVIASTETARNLKNLYNTLTFTALNRRLIVTPVNCVTCLGVNIQAGCKPNIHTKSKS